MQVSVVDVVGKQYVNNAYAAITGNINKKINTINLSSGVYIVTIIHGEKTIRKKFIVVR